MVKKAGREKMTRVLLKMFKNLIGNSSCVSLMIDNELVPFLEIESRKNFKNEEIKVNIIEIVNTLNSNYKVIMHSCFYKLQTSSFIKNKIKIKTNIK
jgi:hypothetical protein